MPLIACPDCGAQVSDQAFQCIKCGRPLAASGNAARGVEAAVTTQQTAKRYKGQMLIAGAIMVLGLILAGAAESGGWRTFGAVLVLLGLVMYLGARFRAWWANG